jgi:hypothetical protein
MNAHEFEFLVADGPHPEHAEKLSLYGRFVGRWRTKTITFDANGSSTASEWEIEFRWVLHGRAVQDVWITPPRAEWDEHTAQDPRSRWGTTLRVYDPSLEKLHIHWVSARNGSGLYMLGKAEDDGISQYASIDGRIVRWRFRDITPTTFVWDSADSCDDGRSWRVDQVMHARRVE